jgi:hypothetical protein
LEYFREKIKRKRKKWVGKGLCSRCGKSPAKDGCKMCDACLASDTERRRRLKRAAFDHYGGSSCACCGETHEEFLCIDHLAGTGAEHRRADPTANTIYRWLKKNDYPEGFRVLCHNCNMSLGAFGYCPHEKE